MARGLLWLPLLVAFIGLAWVGWNEYQKVEAYRQWASQFDRAKYDIYAVLGQKGDRLTWGKPTRRGPVNVMSFSLNEITDIRLQVNQQTVVLDQLPAKGEEVCIEFHRDNDAPAIQIPFTEIPLAAEWTEFLRQQWQVNRDLPNSNEISS